MPRTAITAETRARAKALRRSATPQERRLWQQLREVNRAGIARFRRQAPVGRSIADFACFRPRLVAEVDGSQHAKPGRDDTRDAWLAAQGFRVLRYRNDEVNENLEGVVESIALAARTPPPAPPHEGEGRPRNERREDGR